MNDILNKRKVEIQNSFKEKLGLLVDIPIPKPGFGTTNDGNTARWFFKNPQILADITEIDVRLIERFGIILQSLSCRRYLNFEKIGNYCWETAQLYTSLYNWYYMPPCVHKILLHGASIGKSFILPIGQMSEEAQEARNKDIKNTEKIIVENHPGSILIRIFFKDYYYHQIQL